MNNYRVDYGHAPKSAKDAELILKQLLSNHHKITIDEIKHKKDKTKKVPQRYTKKLIAATVAARVKSNNPYVKFDEEDGVQNFNKKIFVTSLPEYKRRMLAKILKIIPFSPTAVDSKMLTKKF